jgi:hypothetical protein
MRIEKREDEMAGRIKSSSAAKARHVFVESFFQRQLWPARLFTVVAVCVIALLFGTLFWGYTSRLYDDWQQTRLLRRATALLQQGKLTKAAQTAQELLGRRPDFVPALDVLAQASEKQNLKAAVSWREQIARLRPHDLDSQLNLASDALRFGKLDLARGALDRVPPAERDMAAYHVVAGWLAHAEGNLAEQEEQFAAAVKKEPTNDLYQFNLAALEIHSSDSEKNAKARETLQRQTKLAAYRTGALRALLNDAVARNDLAAADNFAQQLQMSPEVTFGDYLLCLNFYRKLDDKKFRSVLQRVKPLAARDPLALASLIDWMNENGLAGDAAKWVEKLPNAQLNSTPVAVAVADTYAITGNWSRLKRWTRNGNWGDSEFLRFAYGAIATRQPRSRSSGSETTEFQTLWRNAEQLAHEEVEHELALARFASKWELDRESEALWLRVAENPPTRREALEALRRLYRTKNETDKLYNVLQRLHETSPNEAPITADLARLGLNLGQNTDQSHQLAKEAYDRAPNEVNCAVTYAFSLSRLGRNADALSIIEHLPPDQLRDAHAAVYVALILAEASQIGPSNNYIAIADKGKIYSEEEHVLEEARTRLNIASATAAPAVPAPPADLTPAPTTSPR